MYCGYKKTTTADNNLK